MSGEINHFQAFIPFMRLIIIGCKGMNYFRKNQIFARLAKIKATWLYLLRKDEVEHYGTQKDHCNGVLCEYGVDNVGEYLEHVGSGGESESDAERQTGDDHVAL